MFSAQAILVLLSLLALGSVNPAPASLPQATIDLLDKKWINMDKFLKKNGVEKGLSVLGKKDFGWQQWDQVMTGLEKSLLNQTGLDLDMIIEFSGNASSAGRLISETTVKAASNVLVKNVKLLEMFLNENKLPSLKDLGVSEVSEEKIVSKLKGTSRQNCQALLSSLLIRLRLRRT